jgi:hypothetical protein
MALNAVVSESVDIVLQRTRAADRQAPRLRSQRSRTNWEASAAPEIEVFRPPDRSLAETGHLPMQVGCTVANPGRTSAFLRTHMSASPG